MKYLFLPIWRLIVALCVVYIYIVRILSWIIVFLWSLKIIKFEKEDFYLEFEDDEMMMYLDPKHRTTIKYYKNPWDALLGRVSVRTEHHAIKEV